ncbi:MAG: CcmD family protein [Terriglobales bacterium]
MKNFEFLFTAWMVVWVVFFVYEVSVARRISQVRQEIERLKQQLQQGQAEIVRGASWLGPRESR